MNHLKKTWLSKKSTLGISMFCILQSALQVGCGGAPQVRAVKPLTVSVDATATACVEAITSDESQADTAKTMESRAINQLQKDKVFQDVKSCKDVADMEHYTLSLSIDSYEKGNPTKRAMNMGGEAEIGLTAILKDKTSTDIANFNILGTSKRKTTVKVGGVDVGMADNLSSRAMQDAALQISDYIRSGGNPTE